MMTHPYSAPSPASRMMLYLYIEVFSVLYHTTALIGRHQATPFMRLFRIKLIRTADGGKPSARQVCVNYLIFSIFQFWMLRLTVIPTFFGYSQVDIANSYNGFAQLYRQMVAVGVQTSLLIIYMPVFLSLGRKSLGNIASGTEMCYAPKIRVRKQRKSSRRKDRACTTSND
jgi:hypothetical protein